MVEGKPIVHDTGILYRDPIRATNFEIYGIFKNSEAAMGKFRQFSTYLCQLVALPAWHKATFSV